MACDAVWTHYRTIEVQSYKTKVSSRTRHSEEHAANLTAVAIETCDYSRSNGGRKASEIEPFERRISLPFRTVAHAADSDTGWRDCSTGTPTISHATGIEVSGACESGGGQNRRRHSRRFRAHHRNLISICSVGGRGVVRTLSTWWATADANVYQDSISISIRPRRDFGEQTGQQGWNLFRMREFTVAVGGLCEVSSAADHLM